MTRRKKASMKKRLNYKGISGVLVMIATVCMIVSMTNGYLIAKKMDKIESHIDQKQKDKITVEQEMKLVQEDGKILEKKIDELTGILWNYQPILIPDSMK
ncbi:hypothetical protein PBV87_21700 [Niameybacter massiliensis]|uniref:Uncharacterized protein n=1 Tax=Holtiella tumoricola TaxID=3018743 RepID=A0AA42DUF9_9FIRM|nr:hypothetical protein [Holtiella tumoricola]MDA3734094.1 hypothetical protein [Holtiella tumoricola]